MLNTNYTEELLGLPDIIVTNVKKEDKAVHIYLDLKRKAQACPNCRMETRRVHSYREQAVKDVSIQGLNTSLHIRKRRYYCPFCGKAFYEKLPFLKRYQRITLRLMAKVMNDYRKEYSTSSIAKINGISAASASRMLDMISYPLPALPSVISIDEFKGNAGGHKFQCILTDPVKHRVLDILPTRNSEDLFTYFSKFPVSVRNTVKYIVMDMSFQFRDIMTSCFPNALIIIDKFHVCRHVTWAMENVRKNEQKLFADERRKYFKRSRWLILKRQEKLTNEQHQQLENMLSVSRKLREAYWLKEHFYNFMHSKDIDEAKINLKKWNIFVGTVKVDEFNNCFDMIQRWQPYILRAFSLGYSNGFTEGCNNKIKVLKRNCYGLRNFSRFRNRILHMMAG
jgi:transposase